MLPNEFTSRLKVCHGNEDAENSPNVQYGEIALVLDCDLTFANIALIFVIGTSILLKKKTANISVSSFLVDLLIRDDT